MIDQTDGSEEQLNKAFAISPFCFNLAITPEDKQEEMLNGLQLSLKMNDEEYESLSTFHRRSYAPSTSGNVSANARSRADKRSPE